MAGDNYSHYSFFAKRTPPTLKESLVQNSGSKLYFNPRIQLKSFEGVTTSDDLRKIKYGVISEANALADLTQWHTFALAGRMQKPVLTIIDKSEEMQAAMRWNQEMALNLAIFMNYHQESVTLEQLFTTLVGFSFSGDIRM